MQIVSAQSGVSNKPHSTQSHQPRSTPWSKPFSSPNTRSISWNVVQESAKELNYPQPSQLKKRSLTKSVPCEMVREQSKFSLCVSEPEKRKRFCEFHNQSSIKHQNLAKRTQMSNRKAMPTNHVNDKVQFSHICGYDGEAKELEIEEMFHEPLGGDENPRKEKNREVVRCDSKNIESVAASPRTPTSGVACSLGIETGKKPEELDHIAKEVAATIKRIESFVQQIDDPTDTFEDKHKAQLGLCEKTTRPFAVTDSDSPKAIERKRGLDLRTELRQACKFNLAQNDLMSQQEIQSFRKPSDKSNLEGICLLGLKKDRPKMTDWGRIETSNPKGKSNGEHNQLVNKKCWQSKGSNFPATTLRPVWSPITVKNNPLIQKKNLVPGQNMKAAVEKSELVNRLRGQNDRVVSPVSDTIQGFRISPKHNDKIVKEAALPMKILNQIQKENRDHNGMAQKRTIRKGVTSTSLATPQSVVSAKKIQAAHTDQKRSQCGSKEIVRKEKNLPPKMIVRPTLLDQYPSQRSLLSSASYRAKDVKGNGKQKRSHVSLHRRNVEPHHQQFEEATSSSRSSSSWSTQPTSSTCSESEDKEPLPGQAPLPSRRLGHATRSSSLEEDYSSGILPQYEQKDSSHPMTGMKTYRSSYQVNSQKAVGRLRKLKDKLAFIFHHHHHHYHHHHHDNNASEDNEAGGSRSLWHYVQKTFHPTSKEEAYGEEAIEKFRRSAVIKAPHKQKGRQHLHAMVDGLLRHIRNSKKSREGRGGISLGNRKMGKKLNWWRRTGGHGGVKLPNRGRIKVEFRSRKQRMRAGKMK